MKVREANFNWLLNIYFKISLDNKVLLHNALIKPNSMYGIYIVQRFQTKILKPWYIRSDLEISMENQEEDI